ncbi:MAG: twin-arginine translocase TatA/TatE family subunit [Pyrinomonadaceae bacterium]
MNFSGWEILVVLFVVLLLFGSSRLPQLARGMGKSINEFKKGISEGSSKEDERELAEKRREQLGDSERARDEELASADRYTKSS